MFVLRIVLVVHLVALTVYTAIVIGNHGWNLLPVFFGDISAMGWPGQFNLDFMGFLALSALWTAWRNNFSALGLLLAAWNFSDNDAVNNASSKPSALQHHTLVTARSLRAAE